jgi:hypothetical protein
VGRLDHLLGDLDAADARFAVAHAFNEGLKSPLLDAYTDTAWAELCCDREDVDRARELATRALDAATAGGYRYIERDAREILARLP